MKSVNSSDLPRHRVFFTEFDRYADPVLWARDSSRMVIRNNIERKLKLLILTKAHVVVASSQLLESPIAHDILRENNILLSSGAIVASLKLGLNSNREFLERKREESTHKQTNPYHSKEAEEVANTIDKLGTSLRWSLSSVSDWFKHRLVKDLEDDKSLLRLTLRHNGIIPPPSLSEKIQEQVNLSRGIVEKLASDAGNPALKEIMVAYADFLYYLSGARGTNSEGVLPQENLVDFSIGDLIGKRTKLSEHEIFFKLFIDTVKAKTSTIFPADFLDSISFTDAIELRQIALSKDFTEKYNAIQQKTKDAMEIKDSERLVLLLDEIDTFERDLYFEFSAALDGELPTRIKERKQRASGKVLQAVASIFIPGYSPDSYKDIIVSGLSWGGYSDAALRVNNKITTGLNACESVLESMNILERQVLLDYVDCMKKKYMEKL